MSTIHWAGYDWTIRTGSGDPGPCNYLASNVSVDSAGKLHLKIANGGCAELYSTIPMGYGTWTFVSETDPTTLPDGTVLGLFYWQSNPTAEIDVMEFSRWGSSGGPNSQITVWDYSSGGIAWQKKFNLSGTNLTTSMTWNSNGTITFNSGGQTNTYSGGYNPPTGGGCAINLWNYSGSASNVEFIISSFTYSGGSPSGGSTPTGGTGGTSGGTGGSGTGGTSGGTGGSGTGGTSGGGTIDISAWLDKSTCLSSTLCIPNKAIGATALLSLAWLLLK